ncbi:MAG: hypothetical protein Q7V10_00165 [Methanobacteriaceae archaeon]|nr:hypothetical protein [Methanobacteriaceae archaeon]MDO9627891.1 hypothetical protein [Methanobacteriaceae archaeon]
MKIVTTPMCEEILIMAGINEYMINKEPDKEQADFAVVLSETETFMDSLKVKLNTFSQIHESVLKTVEILNPPVSNQNLSSDLSKSISKISPWADSQQKKILSENNRKIKVKVYSQFLKDIIEDMGFDVVAENPDFVVFPDYLENQIKKDEEISHSNAQQGLSKNAENFFKSDNTDIDFVKYIKVPSHGDVPINPLERATMRYNLLEGELCMKP